MPEREWQFRLRDMFASVEKIERFIAGLDKPDFISNELVIDAVIRNLEIIGVASHHIPDDLRCQLPEIAWHQIWGMRNCLAHDYPNVDPEILWKTVKEQIPQLRQQLQRTLHDLGEE